MLVDALFLILVTFSKMKSRSKFGKVGLLRSYDSFIALYYNKRKYNFVGSFEWVWNLVT
jgi:hypothetical protein